MSAPRPAAVLTVGTELTLGLQLDTNAAEIAVALTAARLRVSELASVPDDVDAAAALIARLVAENDVVVVTGGLGPTHDDITREAASRALSRPLVRDPGIAAALEGAAARHREAEAAAQATRMADVLEGAVVLPAVVGTAPGQVADTPRGHLVLLPGPPREMRPLLASALAGLGGGAASGPLVIGTTGLAESDVQIAAHRALGEAPGIELTVLARPGEVRVVLVDAGAGGDVLSNAGERVASALAESCFSTTGETLAEATLRAAREAGLTLAVAESCTGGLVAAALTDIPGSSDVFLGGVVSYSDHLKGTALGVAAETLREHGAVSAESAAEMAAGVRGLTGASVCVSITGIAGPSGGTPEKPVGTVWFGMLSAQGARQELVMYRGDRIAVRTRATAHALDLLRRAALLTRPSD